MKIHLYALTFLLVFSGLTSLNAQQRNCSTMDYLNQQIETNPQRAAVLEAIEQHTRNFIKKGGVMEQRATVITIPTVVHVVYNNSTENISDAQIQSQMTVLNNDFRRLNSDADNTWSQAADVEIEFCMATVDPNGNPTNGITRTSTNRTSFSTNDDMKYNSSGGKDAWPAGDYLNMWVCDISGSILGYAQFPGGAAATDGVVMDYQYFGTIGTATAPFDGGRTTTHEVGHWLNLRHIWGDGGCGVDDFVSDTPTSDAANYGCATGHSSCGSTDMVQNYMDYSDDACMNLFTAGQKTRMRALFASGGARASLLNSNGCGSGGGGPTCSDGIQNGDETGVDCGGSSCPSCPTSCNENEVNVSITLDNYGSETSWSIVDAGGATVGSGGPYSNDTNGAVISETFCLPDGCYDFIINDTYGDGICCSYGNGSYTVTDGNGATLASGGSFGSSQTTNFCFGPPAPTCDDGIQNGDETGVDCGGSNCPACPTCDDGIQNGDETGVDCGGSNCPACPTCDDGIQNGDETGIDCGGSNCPACPTCDDGIQNGDETGVDCGGSNCPACPTGCNDNEVTVTITLDQYGSETTWSIVNSSGTTVGSGGPYSNNTSGTVASETFCLPDGCYDFIINDSYGDGICCSYGNGSYQVTDSSGGVLASGGNFGSSETTNFCVGASSCTDVTLTLQLDNYGSETSWQITDPGGQVVDSGSGYNNTSGGQTITANHCLPAGCYTFTINDSYNDGICCAYGNGSYQVTDGSGAVLISGGQFGSSESKQFCVGGGSRQAAPETTAEWETATQQTVAKLFPNPVNDLLYIEYNSKQDTPVLISVYDLLGRLIIQQNFDGKDHQQQFQLNVNELETGYHLLTIQQGDKTVTKQFIKD